MGNMNTPYYQDDLVTLYHGDCREHTAWLDADVLVTDPPYGIDYQSGSRRDTLAASILGDKDTTARNDVLAAWGDRPAIVFGTWRIPRPEGTRARLIWDTKGALGMGDLSIPWKPSDQEIYVLGSGFSGRRDTNVLTCAPVQSMAKNGRQHPHEKPVPLLERLLVKCPAGVVADPFAGSGSTLRAAANMGRKAIGVEMDERYCEIIAKRLDQYALDFGAAA
jgi:site-specific DNA-methyltransferase (adenine-specific)